MKWRDMLIGAIITLVITIVGGIIVYVVGATIEVGKKTEKLVYELGEPITFSTKNTSIALQSMKIANVGKLTAKKVSIAVKFDKNTKIVDHKIVMSSGPAGQWTLSPVDEGKYTFELPTLTPNEFVNLSFLQEGTGDAAPSLAVKSEETIGGRFQV